MWYELGERSESDLLWEPSSLRNVSPSLAEKMGQTYLSRIAYHRTKIQRRRGRLKLSQEIGILIWCNRVEMITASGEERLLFLQSKASFEALESGLKFAFQLTYDEKLQHDFYHDMVDLNSRSVTRRLRLHRQNSRIGIGYRDKGTLPSPSALGVRNANQGDWIHRESAIRMLSALQLVLPPDSQEEEWLELSEFVRILRKYPLTQENLKSLLDLL
jgi:hypothetical protein